MSTNTPNAPRTPHDADPDPVLAPEVVQTVLAMTDEDFSAPVSADELIEQLKDEGLL